jgi:hypothetical protein
MQTFAPGARHHIRSDTRGTLPERHMRTAFAGSYFGHYLLIFAANSDISQKARSCVLIAQHIARI